MLFCIAPVRMVVLGFGASHKTDICKMSKAKGDKSLPSFSKKGRLDLKRIVIQSYFQVSLFLHVEKSA